MWDFGFTAMSEQELDVVQKVTQQAEQATEVVQTTQEQLDRLFNAIQPLLQNLKKNPEKDYIYWPNRMDKIEQFEDHIQAIYQGN